MTKNGIDRRTIAAAAILLLCIGNRAAAEELSAFDVEARILKKIPAGTEIGEKPPRDWTHLVFVATPKIAEGDVDALPSIAKNVASMLQLTVLANARRERDPKAGPWRLDKVAVGFATPIDGKRIVIDSDSQSRLGADLDFIERAVLSGQEKYLDEERGVLQIVTAPNMIVFDAKSVMLVKSKHRRMVMRHAILIDPASGGMGALVWLLDSAGRDYVVGEESMQLLPSNLQESRRMHVDGSQISFLGMPSPTALAIVEIPQGTAIPFTPELRELAALTRYTPEAAAQLESELWKGLSSAGVK